MAESILAETTLTSGDMNKEEVVWCFGVGVIDSCGLIVSFTVLKQKVRHILIFLSFEGTCRATVQEAFRKIFMYYKAPFHSFKKTNECLTEWISRS